MVGGSKHSPLIPSAVTPWLTAFRAYSGANCQSQPPGLIDGGGGGGGGGTGPAACPPLPKARYSREVRTDLHKLAAAGNMSVVCSGRLWIFQHAARGRPALDGVLRKLTLARRWSGRTSIGPPWLLRVAGYRRCPKRLYESKYAAAEPGELRGCGQDARFGLRSSISWWSKLSCPAAAPNPTTPAAAVLGTLQRVSSESPGELSAHGPPTSAKAGNGCCLIHDENAEPQLFDLFFFYIVCIFL